MISGMNSQSNRDSKQSTHLVLQRLALSVALVILFALAMTLPFEDSEIWGITSSNRLLAGLTLWNSAWLKPFFSLVILVLLRISDAIVQPDQSDWTLLLISRAFAATLACGAIYSLWRFLRHQLTLFTLFLLSPVVLLNFVKVRSDLMAAFFALIALDWILLRKTKWNTKALIFIFASGLTLLTSPKSVDLYLILCVALYCCEATPRPEKRKVLLVLLIPPALATSAILMLAPLSFAKAAQYGFDSLQGSALFSTSHWDYPRSFIASSPVLVLAVLAGYLLSWRQRHEWTAKDRTLFLIGVLTLLLAVLQPQKFPFFIASRLPFWCLGASVGLAAIDRGKRGFALCGATLIILVASFPLSRAHPFSLNEQRKIYVELEKFVNAVSSKSYWDAIGLFPRKNNVFHYPSPSDSTNSELIEYVEMVRPKLVLQTMKMSLLEPELGKWLRQNYLPLSPSIFVRKVLIPKSKSCEWSVEELTQLTQDAGLNLPLVLVLRTEPKPGSGAFEWLRVPIEFTNGARSDSLTEKSDWVVRAPSCESQYAMTEEAPWIVPTAPAFRDKFGYWGLP